MLPGQWAISPRSGGDGDNLRAVIVTWRQGDDTLIRENKSTVGTADRLGTVVGCKLVHTVSDNGNQMYQLGITCTASDVKYTYVHICISLYNLCVCVGVCMYVCMYVYVCMHW